MFVSILIIFMKEQIYGGPYSVILGVFLQNTLLTTLQVVPNWGPTTPLEGFTFCRNSLVSNTIFLTYIWNTYYFMYFYFFISSIHYRALYYLLEIVYRNLWTSFQYNIEVLQNICFKTRKGHSFLKVENHCTRLSSHSFHISTLVLQLQ